MKNKKLNRYEKQELNKQKLAASLYGDGIYVYANNTNGNLRLPKPSLTGQLYVAPNERFQGDSYFKNYIKPEFGSILRLIEVINENKPREEIPMNEEKLILDQPDRVTSKGTIEHVVKKDNKKKINDSTENNATKNKEILLTEDPVDGVEIILG